VQPNEFSGVAEPTAPHAAREIVEELFYRCPRDLAVSKIPLRRVMVIGSCLISGYAAYIEGAADGCPCDFMLVNNVPHLPAQPAADYDFQIIQIPMRSVFRDEDAFRFPQLDLAACKTLLETCIERLDEFLDRCMKWNVDHGILTFVWNFMLPQQNPMGRLLPRYDVRNIIYFFEKLNEALAKSLQKYRSTYLFDVDQLVSTFGRRYFQDDVLSQSNHNAALSDFDFEHDGERLDGARRASETYATQIHNYIKISWVELLALYRTIRQTDQVKLVILDIDDTLWRGVGAEQEEMSPNAIEGWPLGLADALGYLRARGVMLALVSKNDEQRVSDIWGRLFGQRLRLDDFAIRKINWRPKPDNIEELLHQLNLTPHSVVFIDDNPVERSSVAAAFPGIRTLGPNPLLWRRVLLWSPETQVAMITGESAARTEMMQAQIQREEQRQRLSRDEFLASLDTRLRMIEIAGVDHKAFPRAIELINRTNQFNTTGRRWTEQECRSAFADGSRMFAFDVQDRFTTYGIVAVVVVEGADLAQFVMSCRVAGMDIEIVVIDEVLKILRNERMETVRAILIETPLNLPARDLYARCGFTNEGTDWRRATDRRMAVPGHIRVQAAA
jgi:FkbH-like protein